LYVILLCISFNALAQTTKTVILDADTANEVDDLFALVTAFSEPTWNIVALNATQWQASHLAEPSSMEESHKLNTVLKAYCKKDEIKLLRGGFRRMYDWGDMAQHSAAAYDIIKRAHNQENSNKITVIALGALTNVASALYIDPTIASKIDLYWLGTTYDFEKGISKRLDFNCVMDIQATEIVLTSQIDTHIMPLNVIADMKFELKEANDKLSNVHPLGDFLLNRWRNHMDGGQYERVLWDTALIQAVMRPSLCTVEKVDTFENKKVSLYKTIDKKKVIENTYADILGLIEKL
ncbi:MAG: nucleoside hydrolase, partial [Pricia sp.]